MIVATANPLISYCTDVLWLVLALLPYAVDAGRQRDRPMFVVNDANGLQYFQIELPILFPDFGLFRQFNTMRMSCRFAIGEDRRPRTPLCAFWNLFNRFNQHVALSPEHRSPPSPQSTIFTCKLRSILAQPASLASRRPACLYSAIFCSAEVWQLRRDNGDGLPPIDTR